MTVIQRITTTQETTNLSTVIAGFPLQTTFGKGISITILNTGESGALWIVYAGNKPDMSDAIVVNAEETVAVEFGDSYAVDFAPFEFYSVCVASSVTDTPTTVDVVGLVKT